MKKPPVVESPPAEDVVNDLLIQPCLGTQFTPEYVRSRPRPVVDETGIDQIVGSSARRKERLVINSHRDEWNAYLASVVEALRREYLRACGRIPFLRFQVIRAWVAFVLTREHSWFVRWPSGAVAMWSLLITVSVVMACASCIGVYKLFANLGSLSDSPMSCAIIATISGAAVIGIKAGFTLFETPRAKNVARAVMATLTAILTVAFIVLISLFSGGLAAGLIPIDRIGEPTEQLGMPWLSPHVQYVQLLLENCACIAATLFAELFVERHGTPNRELRPIKKLRSRQLNAAKRALTAELTLIGVLRGERLGLFAERKRFVARALVSFERKAELARRQEDGIRRQRAENTPAPAPHRPHILSRLFHR